MRYHHWGILQTPVAHSKHVEDTWLFYCTGPSPTVPPNETAIFIVPATTVSLPMGANFIYTCVANSPVQSFEWVFNFLQVPKNAESSRLSSTSSQLAIHNVTQSNAGTYICATTLPNGDVVRSFVQMIYRGMKTYISITDNWNNCSRLWNCSW